MILNVSRRVCGNFSFPSNEVGERWKIGNKENYFNFRGNLMSGCTWKRGANYSEFE